MCQSVSLTSFLWNISKQCRHRPDIAECDVSPASPLLFAYRKFYLNFNENEKYDRQTLKRKWTGLMIKVENSIWLKEVII